MSSFSNLPLEIVREFLGFVLPADLENFALASKLIQILAQPFLKNHRLLISQYAKGVNFASPHHVSELFKAVSVNPRIGYYVRCIVIWPFENQPAAYEPLTIEQLEFFFTAAERSEYIRSKPCFSQDMNREAWNLKLVLTNGDMLLALTVPLLRGLEDINCGDYFGRDSSSMRMIDRGPCSLSKLVDVGLGPRLPGGEGFSLNDIAKFSAIPSVERLSALCPRGSHHRPVSKRTKTSNITELKFRFSLVSPNEMSEYLQGFTGLQSLDLSTARTSSYAEFAQSNPSQILDALHSVTHPTLQKLILNGPPDFGRDNESKSYGPIQSSCSMGSFHGFQTLKELRTDWALLVPPDCNFDTWTSETLPESIETLHIQLHEAIIVGQFASFIKGVVAAKEILKLPRLQTLAFAADHGCQHLEYQYREQKHSCENAEIQMSFNVTYDCLA